MSYLNPKEKKQYARYLKRYIEVFGENPFEEGAAEEGEEESEEMKESERMMSEDLPPVETSPQTRKQEHSDDMEFDEENSPMPNE